MRVGALSVRTSDGRVASEVQVLTSDVTPAGRSAFVVLVHGYANSEADASGSYDECIRRLTELPAPIPATLAGLPVFKFYWPGDLAVHALSPASYPWKIQPAIASGIALAKYLARLTGPGGTPTEVHLVSHSLGGRVVLELLAHLATLQSSLVVRSLSVMACAVPVAKVADPALLHPALLVPKQTQALHSTDDVVLHWAFPPGETLGGDGFFPEAVGRFGAPAGAWTRSQKMAGYDHSDYWRSIYAAQLVAQYLGAPMAPTVPDNQIATRQLPPAHELPTTGLREREMATRSLA